MRLIDKETLCGLLADKALEAQLEDECTELAIKECLSVVRQMPEAVVRCRECIAYTPVDDNTGKCVFLIGEHQYVVPDGYCYLGERKEGAE